MLVLSKKTAISVIIGIAALFITLIVVVANAPVDDVTLAKEYLEKLGYIVQPGEVEVGDVNVPNEFNKVYDNFNLLQQEAGFDLGQYKGKRLKRIVFQLENFLGGTDTFVQTYVYDHNVVGGDINNPSVDDGFMLPLLPRREFDNY